MNAKESVAPSWLKWEKHKHSALAGLAVLAMVLIAAGPRNERRLFLVPQQTVAFNAIPAPEPTSLRSPIMGYLGGPCGASPQLDSFERIATGQDCKASKKPRKAAPLVEPAAFFAMADDPLPLDTSPLVGGFAGISPTPVDLPDLRRGQLGGRNRDPHVTPPLLLGSVPEPATWAMMLGGFALAGASLRRRPAGSLFSHSRS